MHIEYQVTAFAVDDAGGRHEMKNVSLDEMRYIKGRNGRIVGIPKYFSVIDLQAMEFPINPNALEASLGGEGDYI
jgi:hypothetical protein